VPRVKVSGEHMVRSSSGDRVVDRWTLVAWKRFNTLLTSRVLGSRKKGAQRFNKPSREVASREKC
jgi:hypothetical protein